MQTPPWFTAKVQAVRRRRRRGIPERVRKPRALNIETGIGWRLRIWRRCLLLAWLPLTPLYYYVWQPGWNLKTSYDEMVRDWPKFVAAWRR